MFHTIITLSYVIPNIYVFARIWHHFIKRQYRVQYTIVYLILASVYPVSNMFPQGTGFPSEFLSVIADYLLPFYLYLFLFVLLFDIFLLINFIFKIIPSGKLHSDRIKLYGLPSLIFLAASVVVAGVINFNTIRISEYKIEIPARSSTLSHLKIAFAADFHLNANTNISFLKKFVKRVEEINPDILLYGGDIVEGHRDDGDMSGIENLLKQLRPKFGTYCVLGNHEYYAGQDRGSFFDKAGITLLRDSVVVINNAFSLGGRLDSHYRNRKAIDDLVKKATDSLPLIIIDHRPTELEQVSKTNVDMQLSGHTHNGQLFPINLITRRVYELSWGYKKKRNTHFLVTSGIRLWGPPVRTTGKSEIMVIHITFTGSHQSSVNYAK
jgi:predicted MPP superfamily phosphohydrolase